jgi:hypothetical protein
MKAEKLELQNFDGPFVTHGIDVISDPQKPEGTAVYIFAVNHVPNADHYSDGQPNIKAPKSRSQVEIFYHVIGSGTARRIRSVWDPLLTTPNDIVALSPSSFLVTNDHLHTEGFMRLVEDLYHGAKWTNTIYVEVDSPELGSAGFATEGVKVSVALEKMHNNNGLGHGRSRDEVLVVECDSGVLNIGRIVGNPASGSRVVIRIEDAVRFKSIVDNPSYFSDPFANETYDASGFVLAGLARGIDLVDNVRNRSAKDPVMVWGVRPVPQRAGDGPGAEKWETRLLFEDDSSRVRSASCAVLVAIDPAKEGGRRRAWLFVTGFQSRSVIAAKIDL